MLERIRSLRAPWLGGLAARVVLLVTCSTLLTASVVTWVSTRSIHGFVREKAAKEFPAALEAAAQRISIWYAQRALEVDTIAGSPTLRDGAGVLAGPPAAGADADAGADVRAYLEYVLARMDDYEALFVSDPRGGELVWVGPRVEIPEALAQWVAKVATPARSDVFPTGARSVQLVSAPIGGRVGLPVGVVHAIVRLERLAGLLESHGLESAVSLYLVGPDGRAIASQVGRSARHYARPIPEPEAVPGIEQYERVDGDTVIGAVRPLEGFGWAIVAEEAVEDTLRPATETARELFAYNVVAVLLFSSIAFVIAGTIARPIRALSDAARSIADGGTDVQIDETRTSAELALLTRTFNRMAARLRRNRIELRESQVKIEQTNGRLRWQNEELQRLNEALEHLSVTDGLTRLHNHRFFQDRLTQEIARVDRSGGDLSLILIDIDNFKQLNDSWGHSVGDEVLRRVARIMSGIVRESDVLARYGGEEFALLPGDASVEQAMTLAEKLRLAISEASIEVEDAAALRVTVSIGVSAYHGERRAFFDDADRALYRAKEAGKDCVMAE